MIDVIHYKAENKGPKVCFIGGVHGNETCGVHAISKLIYKIEHEILNLTAGELYLIPLANPQAYEEEKRFCEVNLNRIFIRKEKPQLYEEKLAQEIMDVIDKCDVVVDLHSNHTRGASFVFKDKDDAKTSQLIDFLPLKHVMCGWNDVYAGTTDVSSTDYTYQAGKYGVTIECGMHGQKKADSVAYESIISVLCGYKMVEQLCCLNDNLIQDKKYMKLDKLVYYPEGGKFEKDWHHGDEIKAGELIGADAKGKEYKADKDCYICLPNPDAMVGAEWYYIAREIKK